jgi:hypothetical protein
MLETEIKKLTISIDRLCDLLVAADSIAATIVRSAVPDLPVNPPERLPPQSANPPEKEKTTAVPPTSIFRAQDRINEMFAIREEAKRLCLAMMRESRGNKAPIEALLAVYDAKTISQLADKDLAPFLADLLEIENVK